MQLRFCIGEEASMVLADMLKQNVFPDYQSLTDFCILSKLSQNVLGDAAIINWTN